MASERPPRGIVPESRIERDEDTLWEDIGAEESLAILEWKKVLSKSVPIRRVWGWTAAGVLEAERHFHKVAGYRGLPRLAAVLHARDVALDCLRGVDNPKRAA
jgi:hypothetical protein